eukprot:SAG11_NODE_41753_length_190_cov_17.604396_1_plen_41_part_01
MYYIFFSCAQTQASPQPPPPSARRTPSERPRPQASPTARTR